jgi:outer membrane protein assembly factor BamD
MKTPQRVLATILVAIIAVTGSACSNNKKKVYDDSEKSEAQLKAEAAALYLLARRDLESSDWQSAIGYYEDLSKRYPYTEYATQGEIERVYALYRNLDPDSAIAAADRFMREHPRNGSIDYVMYLKGLSNFNRNPSFSSMFGVASYLGDVTDDRRAFDDFGMLIQRFPESRYAGDARERMIYLRNKIAQHELSVVRYYIGRGAYVAAAKRAEQIVAQYPGAPATYEALELMESSYRKAGLDNAAADAARLLAYQPNPDAAVLDADLKAKTPWWKRLPLMGDSEPAPAAAAPEPPTPAANPAPTEPQPAAPAADPSTPPAASDAPQQVTPPSSESAPSDASAPAPAT